MRGFVKIAGATESSTQTAHCTILAPKPLQRALEHPLSRGLLMGVVLEECGCRCRIDSPLVRVGTIKTGIVNTRIPHMR